MHRRVIRLACLHGHPLVDRFRHLLARCLLLVVLFRHLPANAPAQVAHPVVAQVLASVQVLVLALVLAARAPAVRAPVVLAARVPALAVRVQVAHPVVVLGLALAPVVLVVRAQVAHLVVLVPAGVPAHPVVLVAVVLVVHATVNVAHRARSRVHDVAENLKNCSRSSRNTQTATHLFPKEQSSLSVDLLHKNLRRS